MPTDKGEGEGEIEESPSCDHHSKDWLVETRQWTLKCVCLGGGAHGKGEFDEKEDIHSDFKLSFNRVLIHRRGNLVTV